MNPINILIIGGGNMGAALARAWLDTFDDVTLAIAETDAAKRTALNEAGFNAPDEIDLPAVGYDVVVLAVKPQTFPSMAKDLPDLVSDATLVSVMAGITLETLRSISPHAARVMPNTPATIGEGMSVVCAPGLEEPRLHLVEDLFLAAGQVETIDDERLMHAITAISGSGPAYLFAFMEALEKAGTGMGLEPGLARRLVAQTMFGSAALALEGGDVARLRQEVTSPGGTTEAALKALEDGGFERLVSEAVKAALSRSQSMS